MFFQKTLDFYIVSSFSRILPPIQVPKFLPFPISYARIYMCVIFNIIIYNLYNFLGNIGTLPLIYIGFMPFLSVPNKAFLRNFSDTSEHKIGAEVYTSVLS